MVQQNMDAITKHQQSANNTLYLFNALAKLPENVDLNFTVYSVRQGKHISFFIPVHLRPELVIYLQELTEYHIVKKHLLAANIDNVVTYPPLPNWLSMYNEFCSEIDKGLPGKKVGALDLSNAIYNIYAGRVEISI